MTADGFDRFHCRDWWQFRHGVGCMRCWVFIRLWSPSSKPHMTKSWSVSPLQHIRFLGYDIKGYHQLTKCYWYWCGWNLFCFHLNICRNLQVGHPIHHICLAKTIDWVPISQLCVFINLDQHLLKIIRRLWYCFGDCTHHPAGFVIFIWQALLCIFLIMFIVFPILLIIGTYKIAQTVSDSIPLLVTSFLGSQVVNPALSTILISSWSCLIALSAFSTCYLATAVTLST